MMPARFNVALTVKDLDRAFPFGALVDISGVISHIGPSLAKLAGPARLEGHPVFDAIEFRKPRKIDLWNLFESVGEQHLTCDVPDPGGRRPVSLFGAAFRLQIDGMPHVLLALSPGVNARLLVEERGLRLSDFGPADGSADLLPLLAVQAEMLEDSKKKTARLQAARDEMEWLANQDSLTGLPNRRALLQYLERALPARPLSAVQVDLDCFKEINDTHGHAAGDAALRHVARGLRNVFGQDAQCARLGGDEFIAILEGQIPVADLLEWARRTIQVLSEPFVFADEEIVVGASIGLAQSDIAESLSSDAFLHRADLALYEIKRNGRGRAFLCTPELLSEHSTFQALIADMRRGIAEGEFEAYLQPQVDVEAGAVLGFEALARWNHPERGVLSPIHFLDAAERAGLIQELDAAVRKSALDAFAVWEANGIALPRIGLNITVRDLLSADFCPDLLAELRVRALKPSQVVLEIVESVLFDENTSEVLDACKALSNSGFCLALDDFGTGHASVLGLVQLPVSIVKIDRAFVSDLATSDQKGNLARAIVDMTRSLELEPLAEGVETATDLAALNAMGCRLVQGYYFARPMRSDDALDWMSNWLGLSGRRHSSA